MNPLVSLITPVFNGMPYFKDYLECVLSQTWRPLEFICVNDGSEDNSAEQPASVFSYYSYYNLPAPETICATPIIVVSTSAVIFPD